LSNNFSYSSDDCKLDCAKFLFKVLATSLTYSAWSPKTATHISSQYSDKHCKLR